MFMVPISPDYRRIRKSVKRDLSDSERLNLLITKLNKPASQIISPFVNHFSMIFEITTLSHRKGTHIYIAL